MNQYKILVSSLKLLSLSYKEQKRQLPNFLDDNIQDDVITEFDNAFKLLPQIMDEDKVSYKAVSKILKCFVLMDLNISNMDLMDDDDAFEKSKEWNEVRFLARDALKELGYSDEYL